MLIKPTILIDTSYFIFYVYYVTFYHFKAFQNEDILSSSHNTDEKKRKRKVTLDNTSSFDSAFASRFDIYFKTHLRKLLKKFETTAPNVIFAKDCAKSKVWRNQLYDQYKKNRTRGSKTFNVDIFGHVYNVLLPKLVMDVGVRVIAHDTAEADDIIAILNDHIYTNNNGMKQIIITNDNDYVQLLRPNTYVMNMQFMELHTRFPQEVLHNYMRLKFLVGDTSDNIKPVLSDLTVEKAMLIVNDKNIFRKMMQNPETKAKYEQNRQLIDFKYIPHTIRYNVINLYKAKSK